MGSKGAGVLVVSQGTQCIGALVASRGTQGIGALAASVGSWGVVACWAAAARAGRMEAEDKSGSAPPMTALCSADLLPPAV